jgi:hypothetical protein
LGDQIKEDKTSWTCSLNGEMTNVCKFLGGKPEQEAPAQRYTIFKKE